jgi:ribosome biogenesis GTPase / thiamine phosphate phosphatase
MGQIWPPAALRMAKKPQKIRADFRKNRTPRARFKDLTRQFNADETRVEDAALHERLSGKGELTRKRTVVGASAESVEAGLGVLPEVDTASWQPGRVLAVHGLSSIVENDSGEQFKCATRRLLKTLSTDQRHVVAAGDRVWFRPAPGNEGIIERVEPRHGVLSRTSRGRQHIIVTNVDQLLIVGSAAEPYLKPNLIDRFLISAHKGQLRPLICVNKVDLVDATSLQPLVGVYRQMGYELLMVSAKTGLNIDRLRSALRGQSTVVSGQSGVGKSSLLNAVDSGLNLRVGEISQETQKGKHTTTTASLLRLSFGGYVVDTPGIRQFQLWDVIPEEVAGYYRDLRPYVSLCRFPDCTHTHESDCAVKDAVADGRLDARRYESYCQVFAGDFE